MCYNYVCCFFSCHKPSNLPRKIKQNFLRNKTHTHTKLKHSFLTNKQSLCISYLANSNGRTIIKINDYLRGSYDRFGNNNVQNFKFQQLQMKVAITRAMIKASLESSRVRPISLNHKYQSDHEEGALNCECVFGFINFITSK